MMPFHVALFIFVFSLLFRPDCRAQTGSVHEPVRYLGGETIDPGLHEGRLRYAIGVENRQTMRANRTHGDAAGDQGWTYNHGSNLCYWNGAFFQQYLSNPVDEHIAPGQTLVIRSTDGRHWGRPTVVFPPYVAPAGVSIPTGYNGYMMHQRMGFYVSPSGRLLVLGFYGHTEDPFGKGGIGRVVREAHQDGSYGPIYFIRYSSYNQWNESNTSYPFYKRSPDTGFVAACSALLADPLMTFQWWDEDSGKDGFYGAKKGAEALSYFHRRDGAVVALWKRSQAAISTDEGKTFSDPVINPTFVMSGGKQWGQRTADGRFAICYNPIDQSEYRYPLVIVTGDDGILYDHMLLVQGEVPARRFSGRWKDFGPCYMRGIEEGNGKPPGTDMWLTYSMNKEDMWIARIPTPVRYKVDGRVMDNFDQLQTDGPVPGWNLYSPLWAPVSVVPSPQKEGKCLLLADRDAYDYARAIRVFQEGRHVRAAWNVYADSAGTGRIEMDLTDRYGNRPVRIRLGEDGHLTVTDGAEEKSILPYEKGRWYRIVIEADAGAAQGYSLSVNGKKYITRARFAEAVKSMERLSLRTGPWRNEPTRHTPNETHDAPLPGCDEQAPPALFYVDDVDLKTLDEVK